MSYARSSYARSSKWLVGAPLFLFAGSAWSQVQPGNSAPLAPPNSVSAAPPAPVASSPASPVQPTPSAPTSLPAPAPRMHFTTQPPAPAVQRSYHMHDGFYARVSLGVGSLKARLDDGAVTGEDLYVSSGAFGSFGFDAMLGGSPSPGVAVGAALLGTAAGSADTERANTYVGDSMTSLFILGPFIDGFPKANRGWHFGGTLGLASLRFRSSGQESTVTTQGLGGAFWFGHDFWVSDEWSIGPMLRLSGAMTRDRGPDIDANAFSATFLFTGLYH